MTTPTTSSAAPHLASCPWCAGPVVQKTYGLNTKVFCNSSCRNSYNNGLGWIARTLGRCVVEPGLLKVAMDSLAAVVNEAKTHDPAL